MTPPRVPCRGCRSRIDQDWNLCPHCGIEDPHRNRRRLRRFGVAVVVVTLVVAAALALPGLV